MHRQVYTNTSVEVPFSVFTANQHGQQAAVACPDGLLLLPGCVLTVMHLLQLCVLPDSEGMEKKTASSLSTCLLVLNSVFADQRSSAVPAKLLHVSDVIVSFCFML